MGCGCKSTKETTTSCCGTKEAEVKKEECKDEKKGCCGSAK